MDHGREACVSLVRPHGDTPEVFEVTEEILDQMRPFIHHLVNLEWFPSLQSLGNADQCTAFIHLVDDPVCVERPVR